MGSMAVPGGEEEKYRKSPCSRDVTIRSHFQNDENETYLDLRSTIITTAKQLLSRRLNIEDDSDKAIESIKNIVTASICSDLVTSSVAAIKLFLDDDSDKATDQVHELVENICKQWPVLSEVPTLDTSDVGCMYTTRLRNMFVKSIGRFHWLLGVFFGFCSAQHGHGTSCCSSQQNKVDPKSTVC